MRALIADVDAKLVDQTAQEFRDGGRDRIVTEVYGSCGSGVVGARPSGKGL
jgi:hypothetical protein